MLDRRRMIALAVALGGLLVLGSWTSHAQGSFQRFFPYLIDLSGWTGAAPDGLFMEMPGNSVISASREYERGEARLTVQIVIGPLAQGALAAIQTGMKIETKDGRVMTSAIDGLQVMQTFNTADKSGAVVVALGPSAAFTLNFEKINGDEALTLARRFDWKAIQAALPK